jgi:hypothetical protein
MGDRARGVRQALILVLSCAVVAVAAGGIWSAAEGTSFRSRTAIALMVVAALVSLTSGVTFGRAGSIGERAFLGLGPDVEETDTGHLTEVGILLLVSLPLFVVGAVLFGSGIRPG